MVQRRDGVPDLGAPRPKQVNLQVDQDGRVVLAQVSINQIANATVMLLMKNLEAQAQVRSLMKVGEPTKKGRKRAKKSDPKDS